MIVYWKWPSTSLTFKHKVINSENADKNHKTRVNRKETYAENLSSIIDATITCEVGKSIIFVVHFFKLNI